jgi:hypothetical protein
MFAIPGILLLLVFIYIRPQEFLHELRPVPLLYLFFGLAIFGLIIDLKLRKSKPIVTPQLFWVGLFFVWCVITLAIRKPDALMSESLSIAISITLYLLIGHGVQTFRAFQLVAGTLLVLVLWLSFVGIHQGVAPFGCHVVDQANAASGDLSVGVYDGRPCETEHDCMRNDPEPGADYLCERVGLFGTSSIGSGRVRYLGPLQDPNELSLALGIGIPFAFAFLERKRTATRTALLIFTLLMVGACTVFTQSRGGQLVFMAAVGTYFIKRYGLKGAIFGVLMAAPLMLLGGRSGEEAESSSIERLECWYAGMDMFFSYPLIGVGATQFTEHHYLTAHNSYVLAPAEIGFPGFVIWSMVMYVTTKIPVAALQRLSPGSTGAARFGPEANIARAWAMGLLAALIGLLVGIFFLSFCYHQMLWIYIGVSGAFFCAMQRHDPEFEITVTTREIWMVAGIDAALIFFITVYTHLKV